METIKTNRWADSGLIFIALIWGISYSVVKWSLAESTALANVCFRMAVSAFVLFIIARRKGKIPFETAKHGVILGIFLAAHFAFLTVGLKTTSASNAGFLVGTFVVFVPVFLRLLFKVTISKQKWLASLVSLCGLWLLTGGIMGMTKGDFFILIAALAGSLHIIFVAKASQEEGVEPFALTFYQFAVGAAFIFVLMLVNNYRFELGSRHNIMFLIAIALIGNAFTTVGQVATQKYMTAVKAALIIALEPVFSAAFAWTYGGEAVTVRGLIGGGLIVAAIVVSEVRVNKQQATSDK